MASRRNIADEIVQNRLSFLSYYLKHRNQIENSDSQINGVIRNLEDDLNLTADELIALANHFYPDGNLPVEERDNTLPTSGTIDAALQQQLNLELANKNAILKQIQQRNDRITKLQQYAIKRQVQKIALENLIRNTSAERRQQIASTVSSKPDADPFIVDTTAAKVIVTATLAQLESQTKLQFTDLKKDDTVLVTADEQRQITIDRASQLVAQDLAAGIPQTAGEAWESSVIALTYSSPEVQQLPELTTIHQYNQNLREIIQTATPEDIIASFDPASEQTHIIEGLAKVSTSSLSRLAVTVPDLPNALNVLPPAGEKPEDHPSSPQIQDQLTSAFDKAKETNLTALTGIKSLPPDTKTVAEERLAALAIEREVIRANNKLSLNPPPENSRLVGALQGMGFPKSVTTVVNLCSRGASKDDVQQAVDRLPPAERQKNSYFYGQLLQNAKRFAASSNDFLAKTSELTKASPLTQALNQASARFSPAVGNFMRIAGNPIGSLQNWALEQAGKKLGTAIGNQLIKAGGNALLKEAGEVMIKQGLKKGLEALATKIGVSLGAVSLETASGVGIPLAVIQLALTAASIAWEGFKSILNDLTGGLINLNDIKKEDLAAMAGTAVAAPLAGLAIISGGMMAILSAISITFLSPIIFAIIIGSFFIFWIPTINVAPLLSTIVHLESGLGVGGAGGGQVKISFDPKVCGSNIAAGAREVQNSLYRLPGYAYYTKSSLYPQVDLFWCTGMVMKSYERAGISFPQNLWGVIVQKEFFVSQNRFIANGSTDIKQLPVGSAVIWNFYDRDGDGNAWEGHIATIVDNPPGEPFVTIVESNNKITTRSLSIINNKLSDQEGIGINGFGLPPCATLGQ